MDEKAKNPNDVQAGIGKEKHPTHKGEDEFDSNDKQYWNKVVKGNLSPTQLDDLSQQGWKLIAVTSINQETSFAYFFRRRRK